jgi:hypothetical protein
LHYKIVTDKNATEEKGGLPSFLTANPPKKKKPGNLQLIARPLALAAMPQYVRSRAESRS